MSRHARPALLAASPLLTVAAENPGGLADFLGELAEKGAQPREWEVKKTVSVTGTCELGGPLIERLNPGDIVRVAEEKHIPNRVRGRLVKGGWISLKNLSTEDHWATLVENEDTQWVCVVEEGAGIRIRSSPDIDGEITGEVVQSGEFFRVSEEVRMGSILYLKLADGRGWLFDKMPGEGIMCERQDLELCSPEADELGRAPDLGVRGTVPRPPPLPPPGHLVRQLFLKDRGAARGSGPSDGRPLSSPPEAASTPRRRLFRCGRLGA